RWEEGRRALDQATERLGEGGPEELRLRLDQERRDLELACKLDAIRLRKATVVDGKYYNVQAANREYEQVFGEEGLGTPTEEAGLVAARIRNSAIKGRLVAALDDWAVTDRQRRPWLLEVARRAEADPQSARFRDPKAWEGPALRRLAEDALRADLSPQLLLALAGRL